jgi:hypothetical protein
MLKIGGWAYTQNVLRPVMIIQANMTCSSGVQNEHRPTGLCPEAWFGARFYVGLWTYAMKSPIAILWQLCGWAAQKTREIWVRAWVVKGIKHASRGDLSLSLSL